MVLLAVVSCKSPKDVVYLQDVVPLKQQDIEQQFEVYIHEDDLLAILVNSKDPELAAPFNAASSYNSLATNSYTSTTSALQILTVDKEGNIQLPIIGEVKCDGLTRKLVDNRELLIGRNDEAGYYFKFGIYRVAGSTVPVSYNLAGFSQQQLRP